MNLVFSIEETGDISVKIQINGETREFDYVTLIKSLVNDEKLEPSSFIGEIEEADKASLIKMTEKIIELSNASKKPEEKKPDE